MSPGDPFALAVAGRYADAEASLGGRRDIESQAVRAYLANATGEFDRVLDIAVRSLRRAVPPELKARILITAGSAARQLRRWSEATEYDEAALASAPHREATAHAHIGLAADALGAGDPGLCETHLGLAAKTAPRNDWRVATRLQWVRCEHALLTGKALEAVKAAREAVERSRFWSAPRHEAKSSLFLGVAQRDAGDDGWVASVTHAHTIASQIGARAISDVATAELARQRGIG